jgi:hypothetical protein
MGIVLVLFESVAVTENRLFCCSPVSAWGPQKRWEYVEIKIRWSFIFPRDLFGRILAMMDELRPR